MAIIGLTGGYASGKSLVLSIFGQLGAGVLDCDKISHEVTAKGEEGLQKIVETFGAGFLMEDGSLNRPGMANLVFGDIASRKKLEGILHPIIMSKVFQRAGSMLDSGSINIVVVDIPLLFETGLDKQMDKSVTVVCGEEERLARGMKRDGLSREEAQARVSAQMPLVDKEKLADWVIDNSRDKNWTRVQTVKIWEEIEKF